MWLSSHLLHRPAPCNYGILVSLFSYSSPRATERFVRKTKKRGGKQTSAERNKKTLGHHYPRSSAATINTCQEIPASDESRARMGGEKERRRGGAKGKEEKGRKGEQGEGREHLKDVCEKNSTFPCLCVHVYVFVYVKEFCKCACVKCLVKDSNPRQKRSCACFRSM